MINLKNLKIDKAHKVLLGFILVVLILLIGVCNQKNKIPNKETKYLTDTFYLPATTKYIPDTTKASKGKPIPPKLVLIYKDTGSIKYLPSKTQYRDSLLPGDTVWIEYPINNTKTELRFIKLKSDSLLLDLASLGLVYHQTYPIFLDKYYYEFKDNKLSAFPNKGYSIKGNSLPKVLFGSNLYLLYTPIKGNGYKTALDYYMSIGKKITIYGTTSLSTSETPNFNSYLGIRYTLK